MKFVPMINQTVFMGRLFITAIIVFSIYWCVEGASCVYFPLRLYLTGIDTLLRADKNEEKISIYVRIDSTYGFKRYVVDTFRHYEMKVLNSSVELKVDVDRAKIIHEGDIVHVVINPHYSRGIFLGNHEASLFNILFYYNLAGENLFLLLFIGLFIYIFFMMILHVLQEINFKIKGEIKAEKNRVIIGLKYIEGFVPFFSYLLFTSFFLLMLSKAAYTAETTSEFLAGVIFLACLVVAILSPIALSYFVDYIKENSGKFIKIARLAISVLFSVWATYKLFRLIFFEDWHGLTVIDILEEFIKSLFSIG